MNKKLASIALSGTLTLSVLSGVACDKEDERDIEEIGENVDQEIDNLDSDGKDD